MSSAGGSLPGGNVLTLLCMAPLVIPGIVLAIGFYAAYAPPPIALYGTAAILILGFSDALPADRLCQLRWRACARSTPRWRRRSASSAAAGCCAVARVVVPLLKKSLAGAWLLVFIPATRELSTAIFLVGAKTRVISVMMLDLSENGSFEMLAALGFFLLGVDHPDRAARLQASSAAISC